MTTPTLDIITTPFGAELTPLKAAFAHSAIAASFENADMLSLAALAWAGVITDFERDKACRLSPGQFREVRTMLCAFYLLACGEDF